MEQFVEINLFGRSLTLKTESETTKAEDVADYLVKEVQKVEQQQSGTVPAMSDLATMILSALNIANENFEMKEEQSKFLLEVYDRTNNLIRLLDESIP